MSATDDTIDIVAEVLDTAAGVEGPRATARLVLDALDANRHQLQGWLVETGALRPTGWKTETVHPGAGASSYSSWSKPPYQRLARWDESDPPQWRLHRWVTQ